MIYLWRSSTAIPSAYAAENPDGCSHVPILFLMAMLLCPPPTSALPDDEAEVETLLQRVAEGLMPEFR